MSTQQWTDPFLDEMRDVGDPVADEAINALFAEGGVASVNGLMRTLVANDGLSPDDLPRFIGDYLAKTAVLPAMNPEKVARGERLFGLLGPEILMVLGFYALPADYAAKKGVQVLSRTGVLTNRAVRRVFETTQMVMDVMAEGGLAPGGRGVRSAQKVRLMHAAVRHLLTHDPAAPWDEALGVPINQEDLAGTLMTFGYVVLDGLDRLSIHVSDEDKDAYFQAWRAIGHIMGVRDELIPANVAEARELTKLIHQRQVAPSPEGTALMAALVEGFQGLIPVAHLKGAPASFIHFFLDEDPFSGQNIAEMLGVPPADWTRHLVHAAVSVDDYLTRRGIENPVADTVISYVSRELIEGMLLVERGGKRAPFSIPDKLRGQWGVEASR